MFKKTLPPCRTRNARPIFNRKTHNAPNNALKHRNREGDHRRRNRIEDEKPKASLRDDGDEPAAPPPAPPPAPRPRGRPPKQRPDVGGRITAEPEPTLPTLLPTRHARRGSELAPLPKRSRHVTSFLDEEEEEQDESEEDEDEEGSPTRRNNDPGGDRSNRGTSRGQTRATNIDDSTHETPRRRLRNRSVRNPPSIPRPRLTRATGEAQVL